MNLISSRITAWRSWGARHAQAWSDFTTSLGPIHAPQLDFRLAKALARKAQAEIDAFNENQFTQQMAKEGRHPSDIARYRSHALPAAQCLGLDDPAHGWEGATIQLRERMRAASPAELSQLAGLAASHTEPAPWLVWASLCDHPDHAVLALQAAGFRQGLIHDEGICFPAMALGLHAQNPSTWMAWMASLCKPESFCCPNSGHERFYSFLTPFAEERPDAFHPLPIRQACGESYSKSLDAMGAGSHCPLWILMSAALGKSPLAIAFDEAPLWIWETPLARACMGTAAGGFPADTQGPWPLALCLSGYNGFDYAMATRLIDKGASLSDIHDRLLPLWASVAEPFSETGSEGNFIILDARMLDFFEAHGVDFDPACFLRSGYGSYFERKKTGLDIRRLDDFYKATLPPLRALEARALLAPYLARAEGRALARGLPAHAPSKPHGSL